MPETFGPITWRNNQTPAINETNLNRLEVGLEALDDRAAALELGIATPFVVSFATSVTLNATQASLFRCIATGDLTLDDIVGGTDGQVVVFEVKASGTGRSLSFTGSVQSVGIAVGQWWIGVFRYAASDNAWRLVGDGGSGGTGGSSTGGYSDEQVRDVMGATLEAGPNVTIVPNDASDKITISAATSGGSGIPATMFDAKGDLLVATANDTVGRFAVSGINGRVLRENSATTTGLEWAALAIGDVSGLQAALDAKAVAAVAINTQSGAYTFVLADAGRAVHSTSASGVTWVVPPNSSVAFPVGAVIVVAQIGAGQVTINGGAGVTVQKRAGASALTAVQYSEVSVRKIATDEWLLAGDLA